MQTEYVCLFYIYMESIKMMAWKVIKKEGEQWPNPSQFSRKVLGWHTHPGPGGQDYVEGWSEAGGVWVTTCDQMCAKQESIIWEGFCVVNPVRSWLSICLGSGHLVWLVNQWEHRDRDQNGVMVWSACLVLSKHAQQWTSHRPGAGETGTGQSLRQPSRAAGSLDLCPPK